MCVAITLDLEPSVVLITNSTHLLSFPKVSRLHGEQGLRAVTSAQPQQAKWVKNRTGKVLGYFVQKPFFPFCLRVVSYNMWYCVHDLYLHEEYSVIYCCQWMQHRKLVCEWTGLTLRYVWGQQRGIGKTMRTTWFIGTVSRNSEDGGRRHNIFLIFHF